MSYQLWLVQLDRALERLAGLSYTELPDQNWWDMWDSGLAPGHAARKALIETFGSL